MIDPICGMTVEPNSAAGKFAYEGQTYYFCSTHCEKLFQSDPAKYLATTEARQARRISYQIPIIIHRTQP